MSTALRPAKAKPRKPRAMTREEVRGFIEALAKANPDPRSELTFIDPFTLLVAVVLSAQATDVSVNRATETLFAEAADARGDGCVSGVDGVAKHIRSIGLWQGKARNVIELSRQLIEQHGGEVPRDREALETLPGVGRKTANVVLNVAFGESTMAVDTHIFRLGNRTGIAPGATPRAVEDALVRRIPPELLRDAHHWLILHGRYVCKARRARVLALRRGRLVQISRQDAAAGREAATREVMRGVLPLFDPSAVAGLAALLGRRRDRRQGDRARGELRLATVAHRSARAGRCAAGHTARAVGLAGSTRSCRAPRPGSGWAWRCLVAWVCLQRRGAALARWQLERQVTLKQDHELIRSGPYRWVRHPIYTGLLLAVLGSAIALGEWRGLIALALVTAAFLRKIAIEERFLTEQFGGVYAHYSRKVPSLVPLHRRDPG